MRLVLSEAWQINFGMHVTDLAGGVYEHRLAISGSRQEPISLAMVVRASFSWRMIVKPLILGSVLLGMALAPVAAEAKGCLKGAIVGGVAGHVAGHGKVGAVAGCIIGHHEANKRDEKADQKAPPSPRDSRI
jgi:hypothetical protein